MFRTRLLSGIALVAILIATGILGGNILWGFCLAISLIGLYEFYYISISSIETDTNKNHFIDF